MKFKFDKFVKDITHRENLVQKEDVKQEDLHPNRKYLQKYQELPQNRIVWRKK